jgi:PAS domain S-box-containing protein
LPTVLFWNDAKFAAIAFLPVAYLAFVLQYTGRERWLTPRNLALSGVIPCITQLMIWTNDAHGLFRYDVRLDESGPVLNFQSTSGAWYWVHTAYSYIFLVLGTALLVQVFIRSKHIYRKQAGTLLVGALIPWVANAIYIFILDQSLPLDPTPFAFTATGLAFAWGLFRFRLLEVVPAARNAVIEGMSDGVIVLDAQNRVIDLNPAAQRIIGHPAEHILGQSIEVFLSGRPDLVERYRGVAEAQAEITLGEGETLRYYDMRLSSLLDRHQRHTGRLVVLRDITERKHAEETLQRWVTQLTVIPEVASDIATAHELDELLDRSVRLVRDRLKLSFAGIFLADERGEVVTLKASAGKAHREMPQRGHQLKVGEAGEVGSVISSGRLDAPPSQAIVCPAVPGIGEIVLPLRVGQPHEGGQQVIGALAAHSAQEAAPAGTRIYFDEATIAVLQTVADQLAVAVENAHLLEEMQKTLREAEKAYGHYTEEMWRRSARDAQRPQGYRFRHGISSSPGRRHVEPLADLPPEALQVWQQGDSMVTTVQGNGDDAPVGPVGMAALAMPIILRDQVIGALNLRFEDEQVAPETVALVQEVANRLALTLENARLLEETQRRAARERLAREITDQVRRATTPESVVQTAVDALFQALGTSRAFGQLHAASPIQEHRSDRE